MNGEQAIEPGTADDASAIAEAEDGVPCCASCAHARVIPDVRPMEWRCRGGRSFGGLVYRGESGALSQALRSPRRCADYRGMGTNPGLRRRGRR